MILTADLYDAHGENLQVCETQFRLFGQKRAFAGPCATVQTFEDHRPVLQALQQQGRGRVLVVDGAGSLKVGLMGDRLAGIAVQNGWVGVIINGAIRDSVGINGLDLGVKALGATARRSSLPATAKLDCVIGFGAATFTPGDWIYSDEDCILVSAVPLS